MDVHPRILTHPRRAAAIQATANLVNALTDESDDDIPRPKGTGKKTSGDFGARKGFVSLKPKSSTRSLVESTTTVSPVSTVPAGSTHPRPRPRPIFNKTKESETQSQYSLSKPNPPIVTPGDDSDLTSVSSSSNSSQLKEISLTPESGSPQQSNSSKRRTAPSPNVPMSHRRRLLRDETWSRATLGIYVWVLLDKRARVFDPEDMDKRLGAPPRERLWWPGKIINKWSSIPLKVRLFGNAAPTVKTIEINQPSELNIQSLDDSSHHPRFDAPAFVTPAPLDDGDREGSPRKKLKRDRGDLEQRWELAVAEMVQSKADAEGSDDLPEVGTLEFKYIPAPVSKASPTKSAKRTPKGKGKVDVRRNPESETEDGLETEPESGPVYATRWSPPPDDTLTIPGELILARESQYKTEYWPAKILKYVPPKRRSSEPKYLVEFLDDIRIEVPRHFFYTTDEDQFGTCTLGKWDSSFQDVLNDDDDEAIYGRYRSPSPPVLNPPPSHDDFINLSIRQQFVYTKPVLHAILHEKYTPARTKHEMFISGGHARRSVVDEAGTRGRMDPRDVKDLQDFLNRWCLRDEQKVDVIIDESASTEQMANVNSGSNPSETSRPSSPSSVVQSSTSLTEDMLSQASFFPMEDIEPPPSSLLSASSFSTESASRPVSVLSDTVLDFPTAGVGDNNTPESLIFAPTSRQRGCEAYEALSKIEKADYCLNVLLPEAVLQILLWRAGLRTSVELLSEEEEADLHDKGNDLLKESDWVHDVMRLRASKARWLKRTQSGGSFSGSFSVTGRPKRNIIAPKTYQE